MVRTSYVEYDTYQSNCILYSTYQGILKKYWDYRNALIVNTKPIVFCNMPKNLINSINLWEINSLLIHLFARTIFTTFFATWFCKKTKNHKIMPNTIICKSSTIKCKKKNDQSELLVRHNVPLMSYKNDLYLDTHLNLSLEIEVKRHYWGYIQSV